MSSATGSGNELKDAVLRYFQQEGEQSDTGANVQNCIQSLSGQGTEGAIREAIEGLSAEGHIYSTIDENYYKFAM